jgi:hypothetical protein
MGTLQNAKKNLLANLNKKEISPMHRIGQLGVRRRRWDALVQGATDIKNVERLKSNLQRRFDLHKEIKQADLNKKTASEFSKQILFPLTNYNAIKKKFEATKSKNNPLFIPTLKNNPLFENNLIKLVHLPKNERVRLLARASAPNANLNTLLENAKNINATTKGRRSALMGKARRLQRDKKITQPQLQGFISRIQGNPDKVDTVANHLNKIDKLLNQARDRNKNNRL